MKLTRWDMDSNQLMSDLFLVCVDDYFGEVRNYKIAPDDLQWPVEAGMVYTAVRHLEVDKLALSVPEPEDKDKDDPLVQELNVAIYNAIIELISDLSKMLKNVGGCKGVIPRSCDFYLKTQNGYCIGLKTENAKWTLTLTAIILCPGQSNEH